MNPIDPLEERLLAMLPKEITVARDSLTRDSQLADIGFDSLAVIEYMFQVEDTFGIRFGEGGTPPQTLGEVFDQIRDAMQRAGKTL